MRRALIVPVLAALLALGACSSDTPVETPRAFILTESAIGHYCGMNVLEHPGPKGQVILTGASEPVWFSSARDTIAFTMLPEEPKNIAAIYVSDMGAAPNWDEPGVDNWIDAKQAYFVVGSAKRGGMGAEEAVPFSTQAAAQSFATANGGEVVSFSDIPSEYVLGTPETDDASGEPAPPHAGTSH